MLTALVAAVASFAGMVSVMNLAGYVVIDHGHHQADVFTVISLHIVGMYALVLVIGQLVDTVGRRPCQVAGLLLMGMSTLGLAWFESVFWMSASLFLLGLGWNVSYVAAVADLADRALPAERGKLIGLTDQVSSFTGAALVLVGGAAYSEFGIEALALAATAFVALPAAWILLRSAAGAPDVRPFLLNDTACEMKTYSAKPGEIAREWYVVDAEGKTLGRLATQIADTLRGKNKPAYTPHVDTGDFVIVVNAEKIAVTGQKLDQKMYHRHSGYPGGLRTRTLREQLERRPTEVLRKAVKGMLPRNRLARRQITKLKIYAGPVHPHEAQAPKTLEVS